MKRFIASFAVAAGLCASSTQAAEVTRYAVALPHNRCMIVGTTPKSTSGNIVITYGLKFKKAPVVTVSPVWIISPARSVTSIETISEIGLDHFSVNSASGATGFYVSWTAVGPLQAKRCV